MSVPAPFAHQFGGLMPLPMNRAAKRRGYFAEEVRGTGSPPQPESDSSQGRPSVTPTPRRNVCRLVSFDCAGIIAESSRLQR